MDSKKEDELNPRIAISFKEYKRLKSLADECMAVRKHQSQHRHVIETSKTEELQDSKGNGDLEQAEGKGDLKLPTFEPGTRVDKPPAILDPPPPPPLAQASATGSSVQDMSPAAARAAKGYPWYYIGDLV